MAPLIFPLQRQIHNMQDDMQEQQRLIQKLDRLQQIEKDRKGLQDKVIVSTQQFYFFGRVLLL